MQTVRGPLDETTAAAVTAIAQAASQADGIAPLSEQFLLSLTGPGPHIYADGGYAGVVIPPAGGAGSAEIVVAPGARRRGLGTELVTGALDLLGAEGTVWAHGDLPGAQAIAAKLSLVAVRTLLNLRRPLTHLDPAPPTPRGVTIRSYAGAGDDAQILAVNNAAFAWHPEQGGWTQHQVDERTGAAWFDPRGLILAFDSDTDELLGFHWTKVAEPASGLGEVYIVAVAPAGQGRGLGTLLTALGLQYLASRNLDEVELYVEGDNTAALKTYATAGFTELARHVAYAKA